MGKDLLMKLPLQSENVEEEEYFFYCIMKLPLHPKHAEEQKNSSSTSVKELQFVIQLVDCVCLA